MKNGLKLLSFAMACAVVGMISCQKNKVEDQQPAASTPQENAPVVKSDFEPNVVAIVQNEDHEIRFVEVADQELVMLERLNDENSNLQREGVLINNEGSTAFDIFVKITDANVAVPEIIANTADKSVVAASNRKIDVTNSAVKLVSGNFVAPRACSNMSAATFRADYCDEPVSSTANRIEFCDDGIWSSNTRQSYWGGAWRNCDDVYTWTNVKCGIVTVKMFKWKNNAWELYYEVEFTNGIWYANTTSSSDYYRRVERTKSGGEGFRAYTKFVNE